ncbi:MAG: DUF882 domain-containing protein [Rhizobiaceae bacterium]|nr:DUF882 domain-containing protein [Rhizobiaceae bacterium]
MLRRTHRFAQRANPHGHLLVMLVTALLCVFVAGQASAETRSLNVYFVHTKERATIAFKKDGRYIQSGLKKLNRFLRDWRQKESTNMDPRLFDLVWEVYQASGSKKHIHVVSAYRSPKTNAMLRKRSRGVASKSQHILGRAMDFYLPDVPISKLRRIGMQFQVGGVGYYPKSGSPFVHLDVGSVRSWPRMNRKELASIFPKGKTLHLPSDGKPLPGYSQALSDYKSRVNSKSIQVAGGGARSQSSGGGGLLATLFGRNEDEDDDEEPAQVAAVAVASVDRTQVSSYVPDPAIVPRPQRRPVPADTGVQIALAPVKEPVAENNNPATQRVAAGASIPEAGGVPIAVPTKPAQEDPVILAALAAAQASNSAGQAIRIASPGTGDADTPVTLASAPGNGRFEVLPGALLRQPASGILRRQPPETGADIAVSISPQGEETGPRGEASGPQLAFVPLPSSRPERSLPDAQIVTAAFNPNGPNDLNGAAQPDEKPAYGIPVPTPSPFARSAVPDEPIAPVQVALAPSTGLTDQSGSNVVMPLPATLPTRNTVELPTGKAGRPSASDAAGHRPTSLRQKPVLTQNMLTPRAFETNRIAVMSDSFRAPEFVSNYMRSAPGTVHVEGFSRENRIASADQFSGTAVNFMTVARFKTRSQ